MQSNVTKLLAKSYQNPKILNKVIAQLMKNLKSLYFHCDVINDVILFAHDTQHSPEHMGESTAQIVNIA